MNAYLTTNREKLTDEQRGQLEAVIDVFRDDPGEAHTRFFERTFEISKARMAEKDKAQRDASHAATKANLDAAQARLEAAEYETLARESQQQLEGRNDSGAS